MDKLTFYTNKSHIETEWWISYCSEFPNLQWARLRVFSDGSADVSFDGRKAYTFASRSYAEYFIAEDEYTPLTALDEEYKKYMGINTSTIYPPTWKEDDSETQFDYVGTY